VRFTDARATASVCTPTRYALLTGRYAWRKPGTGILSGEAPLIIETNRATLPSMLKQAGYTTGVVGKWHLGLGVKKTEYNSRVAPGPREAGFDYSFIIPATGDRVPCVFVENGRAVGLDPADPIRVSYAKTNNPFPGEPTGRDPGVKLKIKADDQHSDSVVNGISRIGFMTGGNAARWVDEEIPDTLVAKSVKFIEQSRKQPFFLYFATHDIHEPMVPNAQFKGTSKIGTRGDGIQQFDWQVGQILAALDRLNLSSNTLVIVSSDNGATLGSRYEYEDKAVFHRQPPNGNLRGGKGTLYEGGHREPFLARWPGHISAGATRGDLIGLVDTLAACAALTGQSLGDQDAPDSFNFLPALLGEKIDKPIRDQLVLQNNNQRPLALREGNWKLIEPDAPRDGKPVSFELYNLANDLSETNNLAASQPDKVKALSARLEQLQAVKSTRLMK